MDTKERIKSQVSIQDVAALYLDLKPAGKYFKALCPFHSEKTPSFFIMPDKNTYACYGCNKFGDVFTFIQEMEHLNFVESLHYLADKFNLPIERSKSRDHSTDDVYQQMNQLSLKYFRDNLIDTAEGKQAWNYLENRGIDSPTIETFSVGYALNQWDGLTQQFKRNGFDLQKACDLGLLIRTEKNHYYDRFRGRVMIPIFSESGTLLAFGGRTVVNDENKYVNSPDTPIYRKGDHLFGFNLSKNFVREKKSIVLVEGYFDLISLYRHGVKNVVATLGTALTDKQVQLLKRLTEAIYFCYDTDRAGVAATIRGIEKLLEKGSCPLVISYPGDKDPDDFIRHKGLKGMTVAMSQAIDGFRFLVEQVSAQYDLQKPEKKKAAIDRVMQAIERITDPIIRDEYVHIVADYFKVDGQKLLIKSISPARQPGNETKLLLTAAERIFIESILKLPEMIQAVRELVTEELISVLAARNIIQSIFQHVNPKSGHVDDYQQLVIDLNEAEKMELVDIFSRLDSLDDDRDKLAQKVESCMVNFYNRLDEKKLDEINQRIRQAEREKNYRLVKDLMTAKNQYIKIKLQKVSGGRVED